MLACLFADSPPINPREKGEYQSNFKTVVYKGRHPSCRLSLNNRCVPLKDVAAELLSNIETMAKMLDEVYEVNEHQAIIDKLGEQLNDLDQTLSGKIVKIIEQRQDGFFPFAMSQAKKHKDSILEMPFDESINNYFKEKAVESIAAKQKIEESDSISFEAFLELYYG